MNNPSNDSSDPKSIFSIFLLKCIIMLCSYDLITEYAYYPIKKYVFIWTFKLVYLMYWINIKKIFYEIRA